MILGCACAVAASALLAACGDDAPDAGASRADQARAAALEAGLDDEVADVLALAARGETATYQVRYAGPTAGTELVITNRGADRRVELVADGTVVEVRLVTDGQTFECIPTDETQEELACERTDALAESPGIFTDAALAEFRDALAARLDDYTFDVEVSPAAGVEARCLVTRLRSGQVDEGLGAGGTLCVSAEGVLLLVDQGDERLEATGYTTDVGDDAFVRPDRVERLDG